MDSFALFISLIKKFEGLRLKAYQCPAGVWTIGWGSTGPGIVQGVVWTREQADSRMIEDAKTYYFGTQALVPLITGPALSALSSFSYNLGLTRFKSSTLRRKILRGDILGASEEFKKWVRAGGKVLPALVIRREIEKNLFLKGENNA